MRLSVPTRTLRLTLRPRPAGSLPLSAGTLLLSRPTGPLRLTVVVGSRPTPRPARTLRLTTGPLRLTVSRLPRTTRALWLPVAIGPLLTPGPLRLTRITLRPRPSRPRPLGIALLRGVTGPPLIVRSRRVTRPARAVRHWKISRSWMPGPARHVLSRTLRRAPEGPAERLIPFTRSGQLPAPARRKVLSARTVEGR
ncbi:hypothetical protein ACWIGI_04620 [Nocardia sp. NPDC055321]